MIFKVAGYTDKGAVKESNQDSYLIKVASTPLGDVALAVIADGMGGLSKGELASAHVVRTMDEWFENKFPDYLEAMGSSVAGLERLVEAQLNGLVQELNLAILKYGWAKRKTLGTTFTALLCVGSRYSIAHVGDSRVYEIAPKGVVQLTEDQTFVQQELSAGRITEEEAKNHPRRNVLLQCLGAYREVDPQIVSGTLSKGATYLLCSDGFRHELSSEEIGRNFSAEALADCWQSESDSNGLNRYKLVEQKIQQLVQEIERRGEKDNITAIVLSPEEGKGM